MKELGMVLGDVLHSSYFPQVVYPDLEYKGCSQVHIVVQVNVMKSMLELMALQLK